MASYSAKDFRRIRTLGQRYSRQDGQPTGDGLTENKMSLDEVWSEIHPQNQLVNKGT